MAELQTSVLNCLAFIGRCVWHIVPAYLANMAPMFAAMSLQNRFAHPLDFNRSWRGKPILGRNKTFRGFVAGILGATAAAYLQMRLYSHPFVRDLSLPVYDRVGFATWGFLMGLGALSGDAVKSFIKRRRGIPPGQPWRPFDQIDFLLGALALTSIVFAPPLSVTAGILLIMPCIKVGGAHVGYWLGLRQSKW